MKYKISILIMGLVACVFLSGCAKISEASKSVMGTSEKFLYDARKEGKSEVFEGDYPSCYQKIIAILKRMHAHIFLHSQEKHRIVAMNFEGHNNTTQIGIFFSELTPTKTKVEISCMSNSVLNAVSEKIFAALNNKDFEKNLEATVQSKEEELKK